MKITITDSTWRVHKIELPNEEIISLVTQLIQVLKEPRYDKCLGCDREIRGPWCHECEMKP